jgi:oligopeptide/dipeptide ABC transporter ATP-binding protein
LLLEIDGLKKYFPVPGSKKTVKAVDGVSFSLEGGESFGLVGESGCGKSTVARTVMHLCRPTDGRILMEGRDVTRLSKKGRRDFLRQAQMVFQDPYASLNPRRTVFRTLVEPLDIYGLGTRKERERRVMELLELVGLDARYAKRYPHEFSGGQRQRVGIARALALNPKLVILDEAVSALDVSIQSQILNLLIDLRQGLGLTYLFISHDLSVIEYLCDKVGVMYLGRLVEFGSSGDVFQDSRHPYTKALLQAIPSLDPEDRGEPPLLPGEAASTASSAGGCPFAPRCAYAAGRCHEEAPALREVGAGHSASCHFL